MRFKKRTLYFLCLILAAAPLTLVADEGMWLPHQMKELNLQTLGLKMNPADLYKTDGTGLMSAVVLLGGGTGEFVSAEGLILTNHHVAFGALQRAADKAHDYIRDGFLASSRQNEIPALGYIADVLLGYEDVSNEILPRLQAAASFKKKAKTLESQIKKIVAREENKAKDLNCTVQSMWSGNRYYLFRFKRLKDIRLVYAPPLALGNFGGETDNWMWPRHTCDFSFLRAYVSKDNTGSEYNPGNVPFRPRSFLKISLAGFDEGDFTFIMGYPGRTFRNNTLAELSFSFDNLSKRIAQTQDLIRFFEEAGKRDRAVEIKYASRVKGMYNGMKNSQGKLEGIERYGIREKISAREKQFRDWVNCDPQRQKKYGDILERMAAFMKRYIAFTNIQEVIASPVGQYASTLASQGYQIYRIVTERQKPDSQRDLGFQERYLPQIRQRIELAERSYDLASDKAFCQYGLRKTVELAKGRLPDCLKKVIGSGSDKEISDYVETLYARTVLSDPKKRLALLDLKPKQLLALNDPIIALAADLEKKLKVMRDRGKELGQEMTELKKVYEQALSEQHQGQFAPDANGTIRFTYGLIQGYRPRDAVLYLPQTTLTGVIEKETGQDPFIVPEKLKQLYRQRDFGPYLDRKLNDIPACFLNTTNITGGNSGSPVLNARGEQIGIVFDMTYESVVGDYCIIPELQRGISVDIRFVLFVLDKFAGTTSIIKELEIH